MKIYSYLEQGYSSSYHVPKHGISPQLGRIEPVKIEKEIQGRDLSSLKLIPWRRRTFLPCCGKAICNKDEIENFIERFKYSFLKPRWFS
ncbi:MAG: hypothetical protein ACTSUE_10970 [Promethearchaeota archaeon]